MAAVQNHKFQNPVFLQNMETMLSNKKYCDTIFLVNESQFHASSHVVSVSSPELESLLDEHFKNCGDREVRIGEVKYEESFVVILRYIYGMTLDFTQMKKEIMCEVIGLAERFKLPALTQELKKFLLQLECFEIESVVVLLNTAKSYHLNELLGRLTNYACEKAEDLVKHTSFSDLRYDILLDIVKSDCFWAGEVSILKGVLKWHDDKINELEKNKENDSCLSNISNEQEEKNLSPEASGNSGGIAETFTENVLKSLLSHVRLNHITVFDINKLSSTESYNKYKRYLNDCTLFSSTICPRVNSSPSYSKSKLHDIVKRFTCEYGYCDGTSKWKSDEHIIGEMKWRLLVTYYYFDLREADNRRTVVYLECSPVNPDGDWIECRVECQVRMISLDPSYVIPGRNAYTWVTLSPKNLCVEIGDFFYPLTWREAFKAKSKIENNSFEINFKTICIKVKKG